MQEQKETVAAKNWATSFDKLELFEQIRTLHQMYHDSLHAEIRIQILNLLQERVQNYQERLNIEETKLQQQLNIQTKVKILTCTETHPSMGIKCHLPITHINKPCPSQHKNGNVYW
jgi:phosphatidate phosphatase PAH1